MSPFLAPAFLRFLLFLSFSSLSSAFLAAFAVGCAVSQLGPYGLFGYALAVMIGCFSLFALWEVVSGRPDVTADP